MNCSLFEDWSAAPPPVRVFWTFMTVEGGAPTNNAAERALRRAVL